MAHAQKPDFVFRRNGRVHLNREARQFSRLLAVEVCASAVVMLDTQCSEVVWRVLATHSIRQFPLHFPSRASPCAITFQLDSTAECLNYCVIFKIYTRNLKMWPRSASGRPMGQRHSGQADSSSASQENLLHFYRTLESNSAITAARHLSLSLTPSNSIFKINVNTLLSSQCRFSQRSLYISFLTTTVRALLFSP